MLVFLTILVIHLAVTLVIALLSLKKKEAQIQKLMKLSDIGKKITSNIKIKPLMKEIMETVKTEIQAEACSLYLIDEEKQELWFEIALGEKGDQVKEIRLKIGDGIAGWVAKEGVTLNLKDVNADPRFRKDIGKKIEFKQKAMLTMPVKLKGKTIGVLQAINKVGAPHFTQADETLLEGMSSQIAIALENAKLYKALRSMLLDAISALVSAIDAKDPYTNGHSKRVTEYSLQMGKAMGFDEADMENLEYMALLHDVGKIGIVDAILNKTAKLTDEEFEIMKTHPAIGERILNTMVSLQQFIPGVKYHHEKYNGRGYTEGLQGEQIPIEARIIAIADTYDAMTTTRPYRKGLEHHIAMEEINRNAGSQFDPEVVKYFNMIMDGKQMKND